MTDTPEHDRFLRRLVHELGKPDNVSAGEAWEEAAAAWEAVVEITAERDALRAVADAARAHAASCVGERWKYDLALHDAVRSLDAARVPDEVNEADARAIRESPYSSYDLAPTFGVSISTIRQIRSGPSAPDEVNDDQENK